MSDPNPANDTHQPAGKCPAAVTVFGVLNLIVATTAIVFGVFLQKSGLYTVPMWRSWPEYARSPDYTYLDAFFLGELIIRFLGIGLLVGAGIGLLLEKPWGRFLSIGWAKAIMVAYLLLWIAGARFPLMLTIYIYPVALLIGMHQEGVEAALNPIRKEQSSIPASQIPCKRRLRFALRHLLTAVAGLAVVFAGLGWWTNHPVERDIIKLKYGNRMVREETAGRHRTRQWQEHKAEMLALVEGLGGGLKADERKWIRNETIGVTYRLFLNKTQTTDADLEKLAELDRLGSLYLGNTHVTEGGVIRVLQLEETQITDAGLKHLKHMKRLTNLTLSDTQITDDGLEHLCRMTNLVSLWLNSLPITDKGLVYLKNLIHLQNLGLVDTQVTDLGLVQLEGLTHIHLLLLTRTHVTDDGVNKLQLELPNCQIYR